MTDHSIRQIQFHRAVQSNDTLTIQRVIQEWWQLQPTEDGNDAEAFSRFCSDLEFNSGQPENSLEEQGLRRFVAEEFRLHHYFQDIMALANFQGHGDQTVIVRLVLRGIESLKRNSVQMAGEEAIHLTRLNSEMLSQIVHRQRAVTTTDPTTRKSVQVGVDRLRLPLLNYDTLVHLEDELHLLQEQLFGTLVQCPNVGQIFQRCSESLDRIRQDLLDWRFDSVSGNHLDRLWRMVAKQLPDDGGLTWSVEDQKELDLLQDIESLEHIVAYVDVALTVRPEEDRTVGRWTIERALQVAGEFVKDTKESPNLSTRTTSSFQEASLPLQEMKSIRNVLSHTAISGLVARQVTSNDDPMDVNVCVHLQKDLRKVRSLCNKALSRKRLHLIRCATERFWSQLERLWTEEGPDEVVQAFAKVLDSDSFSVAQEALRDLGEMLQKHGGPYQNVAEMVQDTLAEPVHWRIRKNLRDLTVEASSTFAFCDEHLGDGGAAIDRQLERQFNPRVVPMVSSMHSKYDKSKFTQLPVPVSGIGRMANMSSLHKVKVPLGKDELWKDFVSATYKENLSAEYSKNVDDHRLTAILEELQGLQDTEEAMARLKVLRKLLRMTKLENEIRNDELSRGFYEELVQKLELDQQLTKNLIDCWTEDGLQRGNSVLSDFLQGLGAVRERLADESSQKTKVALTGFDDGQTATLHEMLEEFRHKWKQKEEVDRKVDQTVHDVLQSLTDNKQADPLVHQVEVKRRTHRAATALQNFCNGAELTKEQFVSHVDDLVSDVLWQFETLKSSYDVPDNVRRWVTNYKKDYEKLVCSGPKGDSSGNLLKSAIKSLDRHGQKKKTLSRAEFDDRVDVLEQAVLEIVAMLKSSYPGQDLVKSLLGGLKDSYGHFLNNCAKNRMSDTLDTRVWDFENFVATLGDSDVGLLTSAYRNAMLTRFEDFFEERLTYLGVLLTGVETIDALTDRQESVQKTYRRFRHDVKRQVAIEMVLLDLFNALRFLSPKRKNKSQDSETPVRVYDFLEQIIQMSIRMMVGPEEPPLVLPPSIRNALAHEYTTSLSSKTVFLLAAFFVQDGTTILAIRGLLDVDVQALRVLLGSGFVAFEEFVDAHLRDTAAVVSAMRRSAVVINSNFWTVDEWRKSALTILEGDAVTVATLYDDCHLQQMIQEDFVDAVRTDDVAKLHYCTARGGSVRERATVMLPPLHQAVWHGSRSAIEALLDGGVDVDQADVSGWTPLHVSIVAGKPALTELLLERYQAALYGRTANDEFMALHLAALQSDTATVQMLLKHRAFPDVEARNGWTPMSIACHLGNEEIRNVLRKAGAKDLAKAGSTEVLPTSTSGGANSSHDDGQWMLLEKAVASGQIDVVKNILHKGNVDIEVKDSEGATVLLKSTADGRATIVELLLEHGANVNAKDQYHRTPLMEAVRGGHWRVVKTLLDHGADVNSKDHHGITALMDAVVVRNANVEIIEALLDRGADVNVRMLAGRSPLLAAASTGNYDTTKLLLDCGADVNLADNNDTTPLIQVSTNRHWDIFKLLLKNGADVEALDRSRQSLLYKTAAEGLTDVARLLLQYGADVNRATKSGQTPLMNAALHGDRDMVELLLSHGADCHVSDQFGKTAWSNAIDGGHTDIAELLKLPSQLKIPESPPLLVLLVPVLATMMFIGVMGRIMSGK